MVKPNFEKTLREVLGHDSKMEERTSVKTGSTYQTEVISKINLMIAGEPESADKNGEVSYKYPVYDKKNNLNYSIRVMGQKVNVTFGDTAVFMGITGGSLNNGGTWFSATKVQKYVPQTTTAV